MSSTTTATKKLSKTAATRLRKQLDIKRQQIVDLYEHDLEVGQSSGSDGADDLVDRANNAYNREFMLALSGSERDMLREIDEALDRLEAGLHGICEPCGSQIPPARLKAVPWARYCIDCQERVEQGLLETD
ncbi:MAG: TraR/DksA family transcriptional regulator [Acidobacteria bacterium]|nr:TraR/DksA family transcriptional regulator [Acidobacteriota bacterium]MCZ6726100.1 TraR/DksA family transcriptional regulator [Acidobacteriota bacterium]